MVIVVQVVSLAVFSFIIAGCATHGSQFYDSALNDKNRAPASLKIPQVFDEKAATIDSLHNQTTADYLFLKAEIESNGGQSAETIALLKEILVYDPGAVTVMQKLAIEFYKNARINDATYWAARALEKQPEKRELNLLAAGLYTANKNYSKAEAIYKRLVKQDNEDFEAVLYLGAVYTEQKNYTKAIEAFRKLSGNVNYSSKYLAHYYLARVYSEQSKSNYKKVVEELKKSIALKPDFIEAVTMIGQLIEMQEGKNKAFVFYAEHQRKHGPNIKLAEMLSQFYIGKNDYDKAYEQLEIVDSLSSDQIQAKLKMALILIEKKVYDKAIVRLDEILELAPESDKVRFYLAAVYEEQKDFKKAFEQYMKITNTSQYFENSRLHAAFLAKLLNRTDDAIILLKESIDLKIESPNSYFLLSQLYEDKKDLKNSLKTLQAAKSKFPKSAQLFYYLGTLQDRMNLKDDMLVSMKKVIELEPDHAQALNYIAYSWAEMGKELELAEIYARKAVAKSKDDAFILDTLGWVLFKKGKHKEALQVLDKAHLMQPEAGVIAEHLGDVYIKMNLHEKARSFFIKAVEFESDLNKQNEIKSKITQIEDRIKNSRVPSSLGPNSYINGSP